MTSATTLSVYPAVSANSSFSQTITFPQLAPMYAGTSVLLTATADSGLAVMYQVISGPAVITGSTLTATGPGTIVVEADQPGNSTYSPASAVQVTVVSSLLTQALRQPSAAISTVVTFTNAGTLANLAIFTEGAPNLDFNIASPGSCTVGTTYNLGQTCTLQFTLTPTHPGQRNGGISLTSSSGVLLANAYVYGVGVGPQLVYSPATQSLAQSGGIEPSGVATDANGNIFISDLGGTVHEIVAATGAITDLGNFLSSDDVAVDGSGNLFVAVESDSIVEILAVNGSIPPSPVIRTLATGLTTVDGLKIDGNGNIFVASTVPGGGPGPVYEIFAVNGVVPATPTIVPLGSGFVVPTGIAVDATGNVYVSESSGVFEMLAVNGSIPATPTIRTLGSGFSDPSNVILDDNNDVFVTDYGAHTVYEILAVNGVVPANPTMISVGTGLTSPQGIFVDGGGNLFIADSSQTDIIKLAYGQPPTLTFADTPVGSTSSDSPQTVTFTNNGNAPLTYPASSTGPNPAITSGYSLAASTTCPQLTASSPAATLAIGASCTDAISFTPTAVGPDPGTLVTTDNNLDIAGSTQTVFLNANGLPIAPTIVFTVPNHTYGDPPFTVAATSNSTGAFTYSVVSGPATISGATVTLTGAGTVTLLASEVASGIYAAGQAEATFNVAKLPQTINFPQPASPITFTSSPITLNATASSGLPVSFSIVSGPATVTGNSLTLSGLGPVVIAANQAGNTNYDPAPQVPRTIMVLGAPVNVVLTAAPTVVFLRNPVTLTATVSSQLQTATGTVLFLDGGKPLVSAPLNNGVATFTISSLTFGAHSITAQYLGDTLFAAALSNTVVVTVEDFAVAAVNTDFTIDHGGTATYALRIIPVGGAGTVSDITFSLVGAPQFSVISFSPQTLAAGSTSGDVSLVIHTPNYPSAPWSSNTQTNRSRIALAFLLVGAASFPLSRRKRARLRNAHLSWVILFATGLVLATALTGCGSGWRTQVWEMQVTATSGQLSHTTTLKLTSVCADGQPRCPVI